MSDWTKGRNNPDAPESVVKEVLDLYRNQIKIPETKPKQQILLCPVGLIGAGKTTIIKPLSEKLNLVRVSTDEIRAMFRERGLNYNSAKVIAFKLIKEFLEKGYSVAIDSNNGTEAGVKRIKEAEKQYSIKVIWLRIKPPEEFIVNKLKNFKHTWLFENGDEAIRSFYEYKEKYGDFLDKLDVPYTYVFDTSRPDINEQINTAVEIIKKTGDPV